MKEKIGWLLVLAAGMGVLAVWQQRESERQWARIRNEGERYFETLDGRQGAFADRISLRMQEVEQLMPRLTEQIESMRVALKRVEEIRQTAFESRTDFVTRLRDSVICDTVRVRVFDFGNDYLRVRGMAVGDRQQVQVEMSDTLLQVVYRGERKYPWLWIFSPRQLRQRVRLSNPDACIRYDRRIEIAGRKRSEGY